MIAPVSPHESRPLTERGERPTTEQPQRHPTVQEPAPPATALGGVRRLLYLACSGLFFLLGLLGALLPILPATPFLLLCSYFLIRCSPRLNCALLDSRLAGPILRDWQERGGVRRDVKARAILIVVVVVAATLLLTGARPLIAAIVIPLAGVGLLVIWRVPSVEK